ncbi:MAG: hypothetical protein WCY16_05410 [Weeksellaceae bacterium]
MKFFIKYKYIFIALMGIVVLYFFVHIGNNWVKNKNNILLDSGRFTIGYVGQPHKQSRSSYYDYVFYVNNNKHKRRHYIPRATVLDKNSRYFVIFNPINPKKNSLLLQPYPVPDSITSAPPEGWKELPIPVDKEEIRKFLEDY